VSFPAIERRGVQCLGLQHSRSPLPKVQSYLYIPLRVFIQDDDCRTPAGKGAA
jgi:hypothetical protein